jgi:hypothetical protein
MYCYTHEFAVTFLRVTDPLCPDVQRLIWNILLTEVPQVPSAPAKCLKK